MSKAKAIHVKEFARALEILDPGWRRVVLRNARRNTVAELMVWYEMELHPDLGQMVERLMSGLAGVDAARSIQLADSIGKGVDHD